MKKNIFKNPPNSFRSKPFWAWNGKLSEDEIKRQVDIMKEMGFGGFFMHSRVGLETEYLGEEWFSLINSCADYAKEQGLEAWLYDEDRWPSGSAGGMATEKHENRMKFIRLHIGDFEWSDDIICAFSCQLSDVSICDVKRIYPGDKPNGDVVWFNVIESPESPNYNGATYLDTLKKSATEEYLRSTHFKYSEHCAERLGNSIKGIFTDEPMHGEIMIREGYCTPYTESLFDDFFEMWGYDLRDKLPQLFFLENGERVSQVKWHYCETIQRLFLNNFLKPIIDWCDDNNMLLTGHMLHEDSLSAQTIPNGSLMRNYELMHCPGVDVLGRKNDNYHIVKQLSSAARQTGKKQLLSELYGCSGWQMSFEDYKHAGDWQALFGVNFRCPHLSWYTMLGENKRDYPASIFFQSAWYKEYKYLEDYYARLAVFSSIGKSCCSTLVINPVESMWCGIYKGWCEWLNTTDDFLKRFEEKYASLSRMLLENNIEFDYGDEDMLLRLGRVKDGRLYIGKASYDKVIIPAMLTIRSTTLSKLKEFEEVGGKIIFADEAPQYVDAIPHRISKGNSDLTPIFDSRKLTIENKNIFSSVKQNKDGDYYIMLLNIDTANNAMGSIGLPCGAVEQWYPETGETEFISRPKTINMNPGEMRLYRITEFGEKMKEKEVLPETELPDEFTYKTDEPNVFVLDNAICRYNGMIFEGDVLNADRAVRDECKITRRGGEMYQPWYLKKQGIKEYFNVQLEYSFESDIETDVFLAIEQPEKFEMIFNGENIGDECGWWIDPCFRKIKAHIRKGTNTLMLNVMYADDINLEYVYVLGEFGVYGNKIGEKPIVLNFGDIREQGFPHYGGKLKYIFNKEIKEKSLLRLKGMYGAAVVKVNDRIVAWSPYESVLEPCDEITIELVLSRRNTFGPLHHLPAVPNGLSTEDFVPSKDDPKEYVTLPCGFYK